ncbi:MAG: hypothetical protein MUF02_07145 [Acidobacteria bacterium]|jgi:hypothetical protein|nr:hypothetical protein [Acidobacteriota bacterium]
MRKRHFSFFLLATIISGSIAFGEVRNISNSSADSRDASVAINSAGEVGVVWTERFGSGGQSAYFSRYSGGRWSTPEPIPGQSGNSVNPKIAKGLGSGFVAAWHDVGLSCIRCSQYDGSWSEPVTVSQVGGYELSWPSIATSGNRIAVGWMRGNPTNLDIFVAIFHGGWSDPVNVSNTPFSSKYCDLASGPGGEFHLVFQDNLWINETDFFATMITSDRGRGEWTEPEIIDNLNAWVFRPVVAANSGGDILSCFYYLQGSSYWSVSRLNGEWQSPQLTSDVGDHHNHDLYFSDACGYGQDGFLYVYRDVGYNAVYRVIRDGVVGDATALTTSYASYHPSIDYSSSVGAVAAWSEDGEVFAAIFDPKDGSGPPPILDIQPPLAVEANYRNIPLTALNLQTELIVNRNLFTVQFYRQLTWAFDSEWTSWNITLSKYRIYRKLKTSDAWESVGEVDPSQLSFIDKNGVTPEDRFHYQVRGVDTLGNENYAYNWIRWAPNPANAAAKIIIQSYKVYRKSSGQGSESYLLWQTVSGTTNSLEDHSIEIRQGAQFDYAVSAVSDKGVESSKAEAQKITGADIEPDGSDSGLFDFHPLATELHP